MRRFNLLYLFVILTAVFLYQISRQYSRHTLSFYGFAENKETEINLDHPVEVNRLYVTPGQKVSKGELLAEVSRAKIGLDKQDLIHKIEQLKSEKHLKSMTWKSDIQKIEAQKEAETNQIKAKIKQIEAEIKLNESLVKDLKSIPATEKKNHIATTDTRLEALQEELEASNTAFDLEIQRVKSTLEKGNLPIQSEISGLENQIAFFENEEQKMRITAPSDGLIGNIHCKEAENISSFNTLITFYEENPTLVKAYVHENMILQVNEGDTLEVFSSLHPDHRCLGVVTGLGSRIVEIPERLRKLPEVKTYGREVLVSIPRDNHFLQKEKVVLDLNRTIKLRNTIFSLSQNVEDAN